MDGRQMVTEGVFAFITKQGVPCSVFQTQGRIPFEHFFKFRGIFDGDGYFRLMNNDPESCQVHVRLFQAQIMSLRLAAGSHVVFQKLSSYDICFF